MLSFFKVRLDRVLCIEQDVVRTTMNLCEVTLAANPDVTFSSIG